MPALFPLHCLRNWYYSFKYLLHTASFYLLALVSWDTKMSLCFTWWQDNSLHRGFVEPLQENLSASAWGICCSHTQPEILSHACHFPTWLPSWKTKVCNIVMFLLAKPQALSPSDSHFRCGKRDEKWRHLFCFCFPLQLKSVKLLGFSPWWTLTQKIQFNQQLSSLVSPCDVHSTLFPSHDLWMK